MLEESKFGIYVVFILCWVIIQSRKMLINYVDYNKHEGFPILGSVKLHDIKKAIQKFKIEESILNLEVNLEVILEKVSLVLLLFGIIGLSTTARMVILLIISIYFLGLIGFFNLSLAKGSEKSRKKIIFKDTLLHCITFISVDIVIILRLLRM